ncbi:MAG: hypothetical protein AVDCRST_MAG76-2233 [uncultured Acidimicrobiales bacterium]|uniref:Uncharacterized protein n=1 Tax=uncultured Acidimicrobiales bacterium TaxID=310071 RepID=A0A6J4IGG0_9ACTN|nr:MAG: hypothetical protein AVDCRST_MAG76-2233 [uncultured Acidimicrobiales bacterium]
MNSTPQLDAFLVRTERETSFGPGQLQDLLFDVWGDVKDTAAQPEVERWLTLTVERHLFSAEEVREALTGIRDLAALVPADSH